MFGQVRLHTERRLPVVVEVVPGHADEVTCVRDIELSIVIVFVMVHVRVEPELWVSFSRLVLKQGSIWAYSLWST